MAEQQQEDFGDEHDDMYDDEIPVDGDPAGAQAGGGDAPVDDLEAMKRKLQEMEEEAARLRALQQGPAAGGEGGAGVAGGPSAAEQAAAKEEADSRSVYVGNVDYSCTPEELQQHFQSCGTVNRVTILSDKFGNPKGYAYVEFLEVDAVNNAVLLDNTELRGRNIKVVQKRTNVPGMKARGRGRGRGGYGAMGRGGMIFMPVPFPAPVFGGGGRGRGSFGGGFAPRGRGRGRFFTPY